MLHFDKLNNWLGWLIFLGAGLVYTLTMEPTASFWDCGEFIASSYKLEVPHPPGTPIFLLVGRMFSFLAGGDVSQVAYWVNMVSVLSSAATILFLFWTITLLARKCLGQNASRMPKEAAFSILGAGLVGALAFTFSDSFWFSAVEAEVYAMSSFFTAFTFWAMLKWDRIQDESLANRWLILIAYMIGLSIGVHILNLVAIPSFALIYYYKKEKKPNWQGIFKSMFIGAFLVGLLLFGLILGLLGIAQDVEIFVVNVIGMPFGSGLILFISLMIGALVYGILYSQKQQKVLLNTSLLSLAFILIGYGSYALILIRANEHPPINLNNPDEINTFEAYLNRDQYIQRPLIYGPNFTAQYKKSEKQGAIYRKGENQYDIVDYRYQAQYDDNILFPRIYSRIEDHPQRYRRILNLREGQKPSMNDNLKFLFKYQLGHMYWRYFLWNFVGRQSDIQNASWISPFTDESKLPDEILENKAHNQYYMLPLLLGVLGLIYLYRQHKPISLITVLFFLMTGVALVLYLNSPPVEPRERDYIYVGSFYAFAIWMGFGVIALKEIIQKILDNRILSASLATSLALVVPICMALEAWDDHNRSDRYYSVDSAKNVLSSCAPDSILFVAGDNETYPLWYVQEVEGFRTDVRVCNISLLGADWYVTQMKQAVNESPALPISFGKEHYQRGSNDQIPFVAATQNPNFNPKEAKQLISQGMNLNAYLNLIKNKDPRLNLDFGNVRLNTLPTKRLVLPLDKEQLFNQDFIPEAKKKLVKKQMVWEFPKTSLFRNDLIMFDIIAQNNWKRPIHFSDRMGSNYLGLDNYLHLEGLVYRLMPYAQESPIQRVNTQKTYENLMKCEWRDFQNPNLYLDDNFRRYGLASRSNFYRLAEAFVNEGNREKAKEVIQSGLDFIPNERVPLGYFSLTAVGVLLNLDEQEKAREVSQKIAKRAHQYLRYIDSQGELRENDSRIHLATLSQLARLWDKKDKNLAKEYIQILERYYQG